MDERRRRFEAQALPHLDAAYNLARYLSRSAIDADDIVQDAMLRAFNSIDGCRSENVRPWLFAIVRNCWLDRARQAQRGRHTSLPDDDSGEPLVAEAPDPEAAALHASEGRRLKSVIAALPYEFRKVLVLREMDDLSYREIAEVVGAPIGTVMSRLARARALLREMWLAEDGDVVR